MPNAIMLSVVAPTGKALKEEKKNTKLKDPPVRSPVRENIINSLTNFIISLY
jgi:hypothetical protein